MSGWIVTGPGQTPPRQTSSKGEKMAYVPSQRTSDNMSDSQKEGIRIWNLMRKTLLENGLMEEK